MKNNPFKKKQIVQPTAEAGGSSDEKNSIDKKGQKKKLLPLAALGIVLVVVVAGLLIIGGLGSKAACDDALLSEANYALGTREQEEMKPIVDKIVKIEGYDKDPNCLYVVSSYHLAANDTAKAEQAITQLEEVYDPKKGFSNTLEGASTVEGLKKRLAFMKLIEEESKRVGDFFNSPVEAP